MNLSGVLSAATAHARAGTYALPRPQVSASSAAPKQFPTVSQAIAGKNSNKILPGIGSMSLPKKDEILPIGSNLTPEEKNSLDSLMKTNPELFKQLKSQGTTIPFEKLKSLTGINRKRLIFDRWCEYV